MGMVFSRVKRCGYPQAATVDYLKVLKMGFSFLALTLLYVPPMITAAILATEHDLDPPLATLMVAMGLVISFATLSG
jgi:predicted permease